MSRMRRQRGAWVVVGVGAVVMWGCGGGGGGAAVDGPRGGVGKPEPVTAGDFRSPTDPGVPAGVSRPAGEGAGGRPSMPLVVRSEPDGPTDVVALPGDPVDAIKPEARPADRAVTLDALVGQINGKPIYADKFLAPLDARLRADRAASRTRDQFLRTARDVMYNRLQQILIDELLTAEARAELTPEQRQGLFYFVNQVRDNLAARYGGSRELAEETLREREGRGFEAQVEEEKKRAMQRSVLAKRVDPRVNVSWRDVLRAYEKEYLESAGQSVALVRMIMIDAKDEASISAVSEALDAGRPFIEAANTPANRLPKGDAGIFRWGYRGEFAQAKLVDDPALNEQARKLDPDRPGSRVGPFDYLFGRREPVKVWLCLEGVERPTPVPIEEVQLKLYADLSARKRVEEQSRFFQSLIERASFSPLTEMLERLVPIAAERYGVPPASAPSLTPGGGRGGG